GGLGTSRRRVLRLLRAHPLRAPTRQGPPPGPQAQAGTLRSEPGATRGGARADRDGHAAGRPGGPLACRGAWGGGAGGASTRPSRGPGGPPGSPSVGALGRDSAPGVGLRHAHGKQERSPVWQAALRFWGRTRAPAFVRAPAGNGWADRFRRTLKEHLLRM